MINFAEEERNGGENRGISRGARRLTSQITYDRLEENDGRLIERNNEVLRGWMGRRGSNGGCLSGIKFRTMFAVQASAPKRAVVCRAAPFATLPRLVPRAYLLANVHTRGYRRIPMHLAEILRPKSGDTEKRCPGTATLARRQIFRRENGKRDARVYSSRRIRQSSRPRYVLTLITRVPFHFSYRSDRSRCLEDKQC